MSDADVVYALPDDVATLVREARQVVVLSGAGMSAESGVPTFREAQTGLWERFSAEDLATPEAFADDPDLVWTWYRWRTRLVAGCAPNAGHVAVGAWQRFLRERGGSLDVVTQNVDDLHERGGAEVLAHLHGSLFAYRCSDCAAPSDFRASAGETRNDPDELEEPPRCEECGGLVRPDIVWFGEYLPAVAMFDANRVLEECDLCVVVGTSGLVQPAASLPFVALAADAAVLEVNPARTDLSLAATAHLRGTAAEVLPAMVREATR